ncbi:MAG TPA: acyl-CoA dehydrogenase family protein [Chloroflexota bacterium]|nr:acyl-CoA dehydrogenase family protein [Chloroflexota bacterium]
MSTLLQSVKYMEAAREEIKRPSFMTQLFSGEPDFSLLAPYPLQTTQDKLVGDQICAQVATFLTGKVDPAEIERTGKIPRSVLDGLAKLGLFGMNIPQEYGGLGLSQTNYNRVLALIASYCNILALLLSAHQSIGVSKPILLFGNEEQKRTWLPRIAAGAISAFGLTEPNVGSDPANMSTTAVLSSDGSHYVINGEKLWCTNGTIADVIVLMAKVNGKITAFVMDMTTPGVEVQQRCEFMGCRGIENAWIRFTDVKVPVENVIGEVGKGLKMALTTLNVGRISLASVCLGMAKQVFAPAVEWSTQRQTFGKPIGEHELNTQKLARMAADIFAMEAITYLVCGMVDRGQSDFRVEAAAAKLFTSESLWKIVDAAMQIRGGRGYEKADSLRTRGEKPVPIEQVFRDARLYLIGEGASEILKLFIAREVWDPHLKRTAKMFSSGGIAKLREAAKVGRFYAEWYSRIVKPQSDRDFSCPGVFSRAAIEQLRYVRRTSRRLSRVAFYAMLQHMATLDQKQALVSHLADVGVDLFVITAVTLYAEVTPGSAELSRQVFQDARARIDTHFRAIRDGREDGTTCLGQDVVKGRYDWLLNGSLAEAWLSERSSAVPQTIDAAAESPIAAT